MKDVKECRVLVTARSFGAADPALRAELESAVGEVIYNPYGRPFTVEEFAEHLPGVDGMIAGVDTINRSVLESGDSLRVIARYGTGYDRVDLQAAGERGIVVTNTPGANASSVADLAFGLLLSLARHIPEAVFEMRQGGWPRLDGTALQGRVLGLMGFGAIGQEMAKRAAGFGMAVLAYDPAPQEAAAFELGVRLCTVPELLAEADFLSLHMPLTEDTRGFLNQDTIRSLKPGAYVINTARGALIDEAALLDALDDGHLQGAALDTFETQPPDPDSPLRKHPAVLTTPHMGAHSDGAVNLMGRMALDNCLAVLRGMEPPNRVTR